MSSLTKIIFSLIPYKQVTLLLPLTTEVVRQMLIEVSTKHLEVECQSLWKTKITYKYKVYIEDEFVKLSGPLGNRISPLLTRGKIQLNPNNGKAILKLTIRPENIGIVQLIIGLGIYFGFAIFGLRASGALSSLILPLLLQFFLIYGFILYNFRYKVGLILDVINQTLKL